MKQIKPEISHYLMVFSGRGGWIKWSEAEVVEMAEACKSLGLSKPKFRPVYNPLTCN
jgi:hypothetical protein